MDCEFDMLDNKYTNMIIQLPQKEINCLSKVYKTGAQQEVGGTVSPDRHPADF